jgi:2-methylene-furan-3-one reductase
LRIALQTAQQGFDIAIFEKGQSVFIVGGAGGVGSLAIQLVKNVYGASRIVSTASTGKLDFVKSLRADLVIDYTKQSYDQVFEKLFSDNSEDVQ